MPDKQNDCREKKVGGSDEPNAAPKPSREVVVKYLDSPPPSGKQAIHPRRPAPIVPTREERVREGSGADTDSEDSSHR